jgi:hypothetical protein
MKREIHHVEKILQRNILRTKCYAQQVLSAEYFTS